jgi:hypothetical protein
MSTPKLQARRGLAIYPTDNALIPFPGTLKLTGTNTTGGTNELYNITGNWINNGVQVGDVVFNSTDLTYATIIAVPNAFQLKLNADIFSTFPKNYVIYGSPAANAACALYVGTAGNLTVLTDGDDTVTFATVAAGTFLPILVKQVFGASSASNIVALW